MDYCNKSLHLGNQKDMYLLSIRKDDVMDKDLSALFQWQKDFFSSRKELLHKRGKLEIQFVDWDDDERDLWDIPEVRSFYQTTLEKGFPWIYWLQADLLWIGYGLLFACTSPSRNSMCYDDNKLLEYLNKWQSINYNNLNDFTDKNRIDERVNIELSSNFDRFIWTQLLGKESYSHE